MSIYSHSHIFHAFKNREVDSLYVMNAFLTFAASLIGVFIPVYFYELGIPIWAIIFFYFIRASYFVAFTYLFLPLVRRMNNKMMMFLGIPFLIIAFLLTNYVSGLDWFFFIAPAAFALFSLFFTSGYSLNFSSATDKKERGEEVGMDFMIMDIVCFISPFVGGLIIVGSGFHVTFLIASLILIMAIVPLFFFPKKDFSHKVNAKGIRKVLKDRTLRKFRRATFAYIVDMLNTTLVWPLFIFLLLGSVKILGEYISFGFFAGAIAAFIAGRLYDKGKGSKLFTVTGVAGSLIWFIRTLVRNTGSIIGIHIGGYVFRDAAISSWDTRYYELIQEKKDPGAYVVGQEMYYNLVRIFIYPLFMLIAFILPTSTFFTVSFILAGIFSLFYIYAGR